MPDTELYAYRVSVPARLFFNIIGPDEMSEDQVRAATIARLKAHLERLEEEGFDVPLDVPHYAPNLPPAQLHDGRAYPTTDAACQLDAATVEIEDCFPATPEEIDAHQRTAQPA